MTVKEYLKLFRWPNLVIVALSMLFLQWFVINPFLSHESTLNIYQILLLIVAVLSVTAASYVINDFFDIKVDRINKPGGNMVERMKDDKAAVKLFFGLSVTGVLISFYLSLVVENFDLFWLFSGAIGLLWFYSKTYKCVPVIGNFVVAALSSFSFGVVWFFDFQYFLKNSTDIYHVDKGLIISFKFVLVYMAFAFLTSWLREIVKDMEDADGDGKTGCDTYVVKKGIKPAKIFAMVLSVILMVLFVVSQIYFLKINFKYMFGYFLFLEFFQLFIIKKIYESADIVDFSNLSDMIKLLMLSGILSMPVLYLDTLNF